MAYFRIISTSNNKNNDISNKPFSIVGWTGESTGNASAYMVKNGVCFSTFSYNTGTFVPIKGLNEKIQINANQKVYIEFDILPNLQVSKAEIKSTNVGDSTNWPTYPDLFQIQPGDILDNQGKIKQITNGKRQTKCYALIGYLNNDSTANNSQDSQQKTFQSYSTGSATQGDTVPRVVQILDTDIILMASVVSGVPVVFTCPFMGGTTHLNYLQSKK